MSQSHFQESGISIVCQCHHDNNVNNALAMKWSNAVWRLSRPKGPCVICTQKSQRKRNYNCSKNFPLPYQKKKSTEDFMTSRVQLITQCHMVLEYKPAIRTLFIQLQVHRTFPTCTSFFDQQHRGSCQHALLIIGIWTYTQVKDKFTGSDGCRWLTSSEDFVSIIPINLRVHCSFLTAR